MTVPQLRSRLTLSGAEFDPERVTQLVGLAPSSTVRKGDFTRTIPRIARSRYTIWKFGIGPEASFSVGDQLSSLVRRLDSHLPGIRQAVTQLMLEPLLGCVIYFEYEMPAISIGQEVLHF